MKDYSGLWGTLALIVVVVLYLAVSFATCDARTSGIGMPHTWGVFSGCLVETRPGQWIPLDNYYYQEHP